MKKYSGAGILPIIIINNKMVYIIELKDPGLLHQWLI